MGTVIALASGKGGTGKTTATAALSSCLAVLGCKTLAIDFDAELRNLDLSLAMSDFTVMDVMDVLSGRLDIMDACTESPRIPNLYFLAAPTVSMSEDIDDLAMKKMFDDIRENFDYCLIDVPAGLGTGFKLAHENADMSIIVSTGDVASIRDAGVTVEKVREMGITNVRLLINRVLPRNLKKIKTNIDDMVDTVGAQLIGIAVEDNNVFLALNSYTPLVLYKKRVSAHDFLDAARRITGRDYPLKQCK